MLRASLHAAYRVEELTELLAEARVFEVSVEADGDRHVTLCGVPRPADGFGQDGVEKTGGAA